MTCPRGQLQCQFFLSWFDCLEEIFSYAIGWGFRIIWNNQGQGKCQDLDYWISQKPNPIIVLLYIVLWKIYKKILLIIINKVWTNILILNSRVHSKEKSKFFLIKSID